MRKLFSLRTLQKNILQELYNDINNKINNNMAPNFFYLQNIP